MVLAATSVTVLSLRLKPRSTCHGSHGWFSSFSAMQHVNFPGVPIVARSETPGRYLRQLSSTSRRARPIVALARTPGPNTLLVALMPSLRAIGPFTTMAIVGPDNADAA